MGRGGMNMSKRKSLSQKIRFEVFKRDNFKCQYCGKCAPDVVLEVDHIKPVSKGGTNDITNLITSCKDCNRGKTNIELDDHSVVKKQRVQMEELNERRNQLEMMMQWRDELDSLKQTEIEIFNKKVIEFLGVGLTDIGKKEAKKNIKKFGISLMLDSLEKSVDQYIKFDYQGNPTKNSCYTVINMVPRIAYRLSHPLPEDINQLYYVRGILRNRLSYVNDRVAIQLIKQAYGYGISLEKLKTIAINVKNWTEFRSRMEEITDQFSEES
jgi:hypothetical protein